jgi:hypothetical protein
MRSLVLLAVALAALGCAKKTAKYRGTSNDSAPPPVVNKGNPPDRGDQFDPSNTDQPNGEKRNWLNDPRARADRNQLPVDAPNKPGWGTTPPAGGWQPPNGPVPQPGNPAGVLQPQPVQPVAPAPPATGTSRPAPKPVTEADMKEVWIFVENFSGASGKMPPPEVVYAALIKAEAKAAELVKDGSIWLTGAKTRESIWAFEYKAATQGGFVVTQNGVETMTAAELTRRLKGQ